MIPKLLRLSGGGVRWGWWYVRAARFDHSGWIYLNPFKPIATVKWFIRFWNGA